jgi:hypothetical protein
MRNPLRIVSAGIGLFLILSGAGCTSAPPAGNTAVETMPAGYIPQYAVEKAAQYKADFLRENSQAASDLQHRFFYNAKGEACLEFTVTPRSGYKWPEPTWVGYTWGNINGSIGNNEVRYTLTKKREDESRFRIEQRRKDPVFREIESAVLRIATEYNYDFESAYGIRVRYRNPNGKKAVCDGYSEAVIQAFRNHPLVADVEKWSSSRGNHAWNTLVLKDGRRLFCDATWYDGNSIDDDGYVVEIPQQTPVNLTFDINEFNSLGGAVNTATGKLLEVHFAWPDARQ